MSESNITSLSGSPDFAIRMQSAFSFTCVAGVSASASRCVALDPSVDVFTLEESRRTKCEVFLQREKWSVKAPSICWMCSNRLLWPKNQELCKTICVDTRMPKTGICPSNRANRFEVALTNSVSLLKKQPQPHILFHMTLARKALSVSAGFSASAICLFT